MLKLLSSNLWPEIETLAANAKTKQVAVAYVSDDLRIKFKAGDTLITDASNERIASGNASKRILSNAVKKNVEVYSLPNLHSKIFIFDDILVMGSTNISSSSRNRLHEAGIVTDDPDLIFSTKKLLEKYKKSAHKIDELFLEKINSIEVIKHFEGLGDVGNNEKPSLLDLMCSNSYILDDFVISIYEGETTLTDKVIKDAAKKKDLKLPPKERWDWYEHAYDEKVEKIFDRVFEKSELKVIAIETVSDNKNKIIKIVDVKPNVQVYANKLKIRRSLIVNFILDKRPPFKLNKKELLRELNKMLKNKPEIGKTLSNKNAGIFTAKEFARIFELI